MLALLLSTSLYTAAATAGDRPIPSSAYEVDQAQISQASAKDAVWLVTTGSADIYSTEIGLHNCEVCYEVNPFGPTVGARIALKAGTTALVWYGIRKLRYDDHPKLANTLRWIGVGINLALTANNTYHAIRRK